MTDGCAGTFDNLPDRVWRSSSNLHQWLATPPRATATESAMHHDEVSVDATYRLVPKGLVSSRAHSMMTKKPTELGCRILAP